MWTGDFSEQKAMSSRLGTLTGLRSLLLVGFMFTMACGLENPLNKEAKYLGEWQEIGKSEAWMRGTLKIYKAGETCIVETHFPYGGDHKFPATVRDGQLKISGPIGEESVAYVETTDHLLFGGNEFERKK